LIQHFTNLRRYQIINIFLAGIILCLFLYSGLFSPEGIPHPIPSLFTKITGLPSISTGLTRSFSAILHGNFKLAQEMNPYGWDIFLFFLFQLFFRIGLFFWSNRLKISTNHLVLIDLVLSASTFLLAFRGMIIFIYKLSHYLLVH